jgi:hypothetical protein
MFYHQFNNKLSFDNDINAQKKQIGINIPIYRYLRKMFLIFFLAYYYDNPLYSVCIFLMATGVIWLVVFWYEPYTKKLRQIMTLF